MPPRKGAEASWVLFLASSDKLAFVIIGASTRGKMTWQTRKLKRDDMWPMG